MVIQFIIQLTRTQAIRCPKFISYAQTPSTVIDPEHLLSSITSASQLNRSIDYTHIPHPHQKHSTRTPHDMLNRTASITPAPFLMSVGLGVRLGWLGERLSWNQNLRW